MTPNELAEYTTDFIGECQARILGIGAEQYSKETARSSRTCRFSIFFSTPGKKLKTWPYMRPCSTFDFPASKACFARPVTSIWSRVEAHCRPVGHANSLPR